MGQFGNGSRPEVATPMPRGLTHPGPTAVSRAGLKMDRRRRDPASPSPMPLRSAPFSFVFAGIREPPDAGGTPDRHPAGTAGGRPLPRTGGRPGPHRAFDPIAVGRPPNSAEIFRRSLSGRGPQALRPAAGPQSGGAGPDESGPGPWPRGPAAAGAQARPKSLSDGSPEHFGPPDSGRRKLPMPCQPGPEY